MADIFNIQDTWNDAGTDFTGIGIDVTDTASGAGSKLLDLRLAGTSKTSVTKDGVLLLPERNGPSIASFEHPDSGIEFDSTAGQQRIRIGNGAFAADIQTQLLCKNISTNNSPNQSIEGFRELELSDGAGLGPTLTRDADDIFAMRRGANPHTLNIYNTYTDASNYERAKLAWNADVFEIGTEAAGTGSARSTSLTDAVILMANLPTSDPTNAGQLWNDSGTLKVSAG